MSVLQGGDLRRGAGRRRVRRGAWRRRWLLVPLLIVLALGALLGLMAGRASGPPAPVVVHHVVPKAPAPIRSSYGIAPAPRQISVHLKLPLKTGLLFDVRTGQVLWSRDSRAVVPIASLTKMMTALVAVEHVKPSAKALITRDVVHFSGSGMGVLPLGKRVSVLTLLYGLLLPSGNDAAIALADHVAGDERRFVELMNERARQLGLRCTHFVSSHGLERGNRSCAADLAVLARVDMRQFRIRRVVRKRNAALRFPIKGGRLFLTSTNPLLRAGYPGTIGLKTGFTDAAGRCFVGVVRRGDRTLGVVLLGSPDPGRQARKLLNLAFRLR